MMSSQFDARLTWTPFGWLFLLIFSSLVKLEDEFYGFAWNGDWFQVSLLFFFGAELFDYAYSCGFWPFVELLFMLVFWLFVD
jgi:hypothetical protein